MINMINNYYRKFKSEKFFLFIFFIFYLNQKANDFHIKIFEYRFLSEETKENPDDFFKSLNEEGKRHAYNTLCKGIDLEEFIKNFKNKKDIYDNIKKIIEFNKLIKNYFEKN